MAKDIGVDATINRIRLAEVSAPSTPASGFGYLYAKTDGVYFKGDNGTEVGPLSAKPASGTSFPGSPSTNDQYFRTDRNLGYYYDGTRWLSIQLFRQSFNNNENANPTSTNGAVLGAWPVTQGDNGIWIVSFQVTTFVLTTNNGSQYWNLSFDWRTQANANNVLSTTNTSADTATNWYDKTLTVGALLDSTARYLHLIATKTSTPGNLYVYPCILYRYVG
jgi:hypothetical protein